MSSHARALGAPRLGSPLEDADLLLEIFLKEVRKFCSFHKTIIINEMLFWTQKWVKDSCIFDIQIHSPEGNVFQIPQDLHAPLFDSLITNETWLCKVRLLKDGEDNRWVQLREKHCLYSIGHCILLLDISSFCLTYYSYPTFYILLTLHNQWFSSEVVFFINKLNNNMICTSNSLECVLQC